MFLDDLQIVQLVEQLNDNIWKVTLDKMDSDMLFRDKLLGSEFKVFTKSHTKPIFYVKRKE